MVDQRNISKTLIIRKSTIVMLLRVILFELLSGVLYVLLRIGLQLIDIQFDSELSLTPIALFKSFLFMTAEITIAVYVILHWLSNYYALSSKEITYVTGMVSKRENSYSLANVQSVSFEQGLVGRILNYGTVKIFSPVLKQELYMTEVSNPRQIVDHVKDLLIVDKMNFILRK